MLLSVLTILTLYLHASTNTEFKKHVQNSVYPFDMEQPTYDIESWVKQLHLQQCAFVEVGDKYYAIFVETRPRVYDQEKGIQEYFLGLCDDDTLNKWSFCSSNLQKKRDTDCTFFMNDMYGARVHRRLCDVNLLALNAPQCDCNNDLSDSKLIKVQGFPTCFKAPLPDSLCGDNNVCGLSACLPETINKRVHTVRCDQSCHHQQPFCEPPDKKSSEPRHISSFWTDWSNPFCTDVSCLSQFDEATCINSETGKGDIDCLGPGTSCCTSDLQNCRCHVYEEEGVAKVFRTFSIPPPELVEFMSEEDFINNIPLRYLKGGYLDRAARSNIGKAVKKTIYEIYDHRPVKFGNTYKLDARHFHPIKKTVMKKLGSASTAAAVTVPRKRRDPKLLTKKRDILLAIKMKPEIVNIIRSENTDSVNTRQLELKLDKINQLNHIMSRKATTPFVVAFKEIPEQFHYKPVTTSTETNVSNQTEHSSRSTAADNAFSIEEEEEEIDSGTPSKCVDETTSEECLKTNACNPESTSENNPTGDFIPDDLEFEKKIDNLLEHSKTPSGESQLNATTESMENILASYTRDESSTPDENDNMIFEPKEVEKRHKKMKKMKKVKNANSRSEEDEDDNTYINPRTILPTNNVIYNTVPVADEDQDEEVAFNLTGCQETAATERETINLQNFRQRKRSVRDEEIFDDDDDNMDDGQDEDIMLEYGEMETTTKRSKSSTFHERGEYNNANLLAENEALLNQENVKNATADETTNYSTKIFNINFIYYIILVFLIFIC